jgi:RNA polymerase sigma-70 factor (ECF subfamily)
LKRNEVTPVSNHAFKIHATKSLRDRIHAYFQRRVPNEASDLTQETYLRIMQASPQLSDASSAQAYAWVVAKRVLIDHFRKSSRRASIVLFPGAEYDRTALTMPASSDLAAKEILSIVTETLSNTKPELREVFQLRMADNLSFRDIAEKQSVSLNTALGRMHQVIKKLKHALEQAGYAQGASS